MNVLPLCRVQHSNPASLEALAGFNMSLSILRLRLELGPLATQCLTGCDDPMRGLQSLLDAGCIEEAVRLAAHALPRHHAVWWACLSVRAMPDCLASDAAREALSAAERWVAQPDEERRRDAMAAARAAEFNGAEAWAAMGAFWSGGSMALPDEPPVPAPEHLTGVAVAGCVSLAATRRRPEQAFRRMRRCVEAAMEIARGGGGTIFL